VTEVSDTNDICKVRAGHVLYGVEVRVRLDTILSSVPEGDE
jgi:hypothetical protein